MRRSALWAWPLVAALFLCLGPVPNSARAGEADDQALHDLITRLAAQVEMLVQKVERLDKKVSELQTKLALGAQPAAGSPAAPNVGGTGPGAGMGERPLAATQPSAGVAGSTPAATSGAGAARARDVSKLVKPGHRFTHGKRITSEYIEPIERTFVRLEPFALPVAGEGGDLALGALLAYPGRVTRGVPDSVVLDFVSKDPRWTRESKREVTFYVDTVKHKLGVPLFKEDVKLGGARSVTFSLSVPMAVFLEILDGKDVVGTLGEVEFSVPPSGLEALRDLVCRTVPGAGPAPPAVGTGASK